MPASVKRKKSAPARVKKSARWGAGETALILCAVYVMLSFLRYVLAKATSAYPLTVIDEFLYYSLARSIAAGEGLLFRGQQAAYAFILYPLALSPAFALFKGSPNIYRLLQLWNILLMGLSLFPMYFLSLRVLKNQGKALGAAALCMLLPEMALGGSLVSECVVYPLFFATLYCMYRYLEGRSLRDLVLVGVLGGLMYFTKPGQAVPAGLCIAWALAGAIRRRERGEIRHALCALGAMLAVIIAFYALVIVGFGMKTSLFSLYERQLPAQSGVRPGVFLKALALYVYYFILACGILCFVIPLINRPKYEKNTRALCDITLLSLLVTMIGTAAVINMAEFTSATIHMRYIAMYIPVLLMLCLIKAGDDAPARSPLLGDRALLPPLPACAALAYVALCSFLFGCGAGTDANTSQIANLSLSMFYDGILSDQAVIGTVLSLVCVPVCFWLLARMPLRRARVIGVSALAALMAFNNGTAYVMQFRRANFIIPAEAAWVDEQIGEEEFLYVFGSEGVINYASLDVRRPESGCQVLYNDLFNHVNEANGVYAPFIPVALSGTAPDRLTPDTDTLVVDMDVAAMMDLAPGVTHRETPQSTYHIISFTKGERLVNSIIANVAGFLLPSGETGILAVYDETLLSGPLTVRLEVQSAAPATITCYCEGEALTCAIDISRQVCSFTFQSPKAAFNFVSDAGELNVYSYELVRGE